MWESMTGKKFHISRFGLCIAVFLFLGATWTRAQHPARNFTVRTLQGTAPRHADFAKGVSAAFAGIADQRLLVAGGCNFPNIPAAQGGAKQYYDEVFVASACDTALVWKKVGELPQPTAYGVSVVTAEGIVCVGGMNDNGALNAVIRLSLEKGRAKQEILPSLPCTLDNMAGCLAGNWLFVVGGNRNGVPSNACYRLDLEHLSQGWERLPDFPGSPRQQPVCAAQRDSAGKISVYMWGGFAPAAEGREASLSVDGWRYSLEENKWMPLPSPRDADGQSISLGGGTAVAWGDSLILCMGGVDKDIFLQALRQPAPDYLTHSPEWYKFNKKLLVYDVCRGEWQTACCSPDLARAGAVAVPYGNSVFCINGEVKPGVRTSCITKIEVK